MEERKANNRFTVSILTVMFTVSVCNTIQGALLTDLIDQYNLKSAMQGALSSFQSIGSLVALIIAALGADRFGKPFMIGILSVLIVLSMLGAALQPAFILLVAFYVIYGVGKGMADTSTSSMIADLHTGRSTAVYMGLLHGVFGIGGLLAPIFILQLKNGGMAWNHVYLVFAGIAFASMAFYYITKAQTKQALQPYFKRTNNFDFKLLKSYFKVKKNWLFLGSLLCFSIYQIGYYLWINRYVAVQMNNASMGSLALALFWIGTAITRIFTPKLKIPAVKLIIWGNIGAMAAALIGIWSMSIPVILVCSFFAGFMNGATNSLLLYIGCAWMRENTMFVTTVAFLIFYLGQIVCPPAVGILNSTAGMSVGMSCAAVFALLSSLCLIPLRREKL